MELFVHEFCGALFICGSKRDLAHMKMDVVAYFLCLYRQCLHK